MTSTDREVVRVSGVLPVDGGVVSLEAVTDPRQVWRHRFFLSDDGARAVSAVVLLAAESGSAAKAASSAPRTELPRTELPLDRLLPRTWLRPSERIVLYWEVATPSASPRTMLLEFRRVDQSTWGRMSSLFQAGPDGRTVRVAPGPLVPMVRTAERSGFGLPFALSALEPGEYEVRAIVAATATQEELSGPTVRFTLRPGER